MPVVGICRLRALPSYISFPIFKMSIEQYENTNNHHREESDHQEDASIQQRLEIIEATVMKIATLLENQQAVKEWYSISDAAEVLGKAEFTVREWCRLGRVNAHKRACGRGRSQEWILSHTEIERIQNKGLLPHDL